MKNAPSLFSPPPIDSSFEQSEPGLNIDSASTPATAPVPPLTEPASPAEPQSDAIKNADDATTLGEQQSNADSPEAPKAQPPAGPIDDTISFNLQLIDFAGDPIAGLKYRIIVGKTEYGGTTDDKGNGQEISGLKPLEPLEILVCKSNGDYSSKYKGFTECADMNVCGVSPHIKVPVTTDRHEGEPIPAPSAEPGPAAPAPVPVVPADVAQAKPAPAPAPTTSNAPPAPTAPGKGQIESGGKGTNKETTECRNTKGNPTVTLWERAVDWAKRNRIPTFGIWNWDDFRPNAQGCTSPALKENSPGNDMPPGKAPSKDLSKAGTSPQIKVTDPEQAAPKKVKELLAIMEEQTGWEWAKMYEDDKLKSADIVAGLMKKTFKPRTGKDTGKFDGRCYPALKIGLLRAGLVSGINDDIPAKTAGPWLELHDYKNVTKEIPDARWALPGDVIVYRYTDEIESANNKKMEGAKKQFEKKLAAYNEQKAAFEKEVKEWKAATERRKLEKEDAKKKKVKYSGGADPKKPTLGPAPKPPTDINYGHVDVRTYDGYLSDAKARRLPLAKKFVVLGIYRKIYDPVPDFRLRAFLKILREWECHGESNDAKRYFMLNRPLNGSKTFTNTSKHPWEPGGPNAGSASGAYQIQLETYQDYIKPIWGIEPGFSPQNQDRVAVTMFENRWENGPDSMNVLSLIRTGEIERAVKLLKGTWVSLPGGSQPRKEDKTKRVMTMDDVMARYKIFMAELIEKQNERK